MRHAARALALLTIAVALCSCGSYTRADFIAGADAICASAVRQTRTLEPPQSEQMSALAAYLARVLPIVRHETRQLRALRRPSQPAQAARRLGRYLAAVAEVGRDYAALAAAAARGSAPAVASAEAELRAIPLASLAAGYGLRSCGTPGATVS